MKEVWTGIPGLDHSKAAGLLSSSDPHWSLTQDMLFDSCPQEWWQSYRFGRKSKAIMLAIGGAVHEVAATINRKAKRSPDGIDADDVNRAIREKAKKLGKFGFFKRIHAGLTWVAQEANDTREHIVAVEEEMSWDTKIRVPWSAKTVRVVGRFDRRGTHPKHGNEPVIRDYKTAGKVPTQSELEDDPQLNLYIALYREATGYAGNMWGEWASVLQQKVIEAAFDNASAELAKQWIIGEIERAVAAIKAQRFPATPYRRCGDCPVASKCGAWRKERSELTVAGVPPSLSEYMRLGGRQEAMGDMRDRVKEHILHRLDESGGILHEAGWRAEMRETKGGLPERYQGFTTVAEFVAELTEPVKSTLRVRRAR